jgi:hypothetical protein
MKNKPNNKPPPQPKKKEKSAGVGGCFSLLSRMALLLLFLTKKTGK